MAGRGNYWQVSFQSSESLRSREPDQGHHDCVRGEYCSGVKMAADGSGMVPAMTYRAFCDGCQDHVGRCLREMPGLFLRLEFEMAEALMSEMLCRVPFGPKVSLRLDIDEVMRATAASLATWEARVRSTARLSPRDLSVPVLSPESVRDAVKLLNTHLTALLALQPKGMTQVIPLPPRRDDDSALTWNDYLPSGELLPPKERPLPIPPDIAEMLADAEIVRIGVDFVATMKQRGGSDAGMEILDLHHRARRILAETRPRPADLPDFPCRECEHKSLVLADPAWHDDEPDYYSRCLNCKDRMTRDDYDQNGKRWVAYYKHTQVRPVLEAPAAA